VPCLVFGLLIPLW